MKAVIPVAKKKDSMFPFSESKPTGLMPVAGKPLVSHLVSQLQSLGVDDIYLVTNYLEQQFEDRFGSYTNVNIVHQAQLEGTAPAVACCDFIEEDFFVVNGDVTVSERDMQNLLDKHRGSDDPVTMLGTDQDKPEKFGVLSITNDRVEAIEEKPEQAENPLINTGIYIFSASIFDYIDSLEEGQTSITDAVSAIVEDNVARFELVQDYWLDVDSPRKLLKADRVKRRQGNSTGVHPGAEVSQKAEVSDDSMVAENAVVKAGSVIEGGSYVAEDAVVGPGTVVKNSSIGPGSVLENCSLGSSLVFEKTEIGPETSIQGSILGEGATVRPGTVIQESFIGPRSFVEMSNSIRDVTFVPDARTDLGEISK